jgi:hypothetical protein
MDAGVPELVTARTEAVRFLNTRTFIGDSLHLARVREKHLNTGNCVNCVPTVTIAIPPELKERMERYNDINWSAVARNIIERKLELLERMDRLLEKSELTEEDAILLGRQAKAAAARGARRAARR